MKKLVIKNITELFEELDADKATLDIVYGLLQHHNDLVDDYNRDDKHQQYLMYQLKQQIFKMVMDLKKANSKSDKSKKSNVEAFINNIKNKKNAN